MYLNILLQMHWSTTKVKLFFELVYLYWIYEYIYMCIYTMNSHK